MSEAYCADEEGILLAKSIASSPIYLLKTQQKLGETQGFPVVNGPLQRLNVEFSGDQLLGISLWGHVALTSLKHSP